MDDDLDMDDDGGSNDDDSEDDDTGGRDVDSEDGSDTSYKDISLRLLAAEDVEVNDSLEVWLNMHGMRVKRGFLNRPMR
jgi:hypothetical protein